jgi:RNA polymerase subunit RPABC4/transcription elongation factor Spt4
MKTCPQCNELLGESVEKCFKCGYTFKAESGISRNVSRQSAKAQTRICPKCQKVYYNVTYDTCPNCHSPLALYSERAKQLAEQQEKSGGSRENITSKFGLEDLDVTDLASVNWINHELFGNGVLEFASIFSGAKNSDLVMMSCLRALVEQNWVLTRQLNKINKKLEEVVKIIDTKTP